MAANMLPILALGAAALFLMKKKGNGAAGASGLQAADYDPEEDDPWFQHLNAQIAERNAQWQMTAYNQKHVVLEAGVVTTTVNGRCYWALVQTVELVPGEGLIEDVLKFHVYGVCPSGGAIERQSQTTGDKAMAAMFAHMQEDSGSGPSTGNGDNTGPSGYSNVTVGEMMVIQQQLLALGFSPGTINGQWSYGSSTYNAVKGFQAANNLEDDGKPGSLTQAKLNELSAAL